MSVITEQPTDSLNILGANNKHSDVTMKTPEYTDSLNLLGVKNKHSDVTMKSPEE